VARRSASTPEETTAVEGDTGGTPVVAARVVAAREVVVRGVAVEGAEDPLQREGSTSIFLSHRFREAHRVDGAPHLAREGFLPDAKEDLPPSRPLGESIIVKP
jgi:hypothetical protein